MNDVVNPDRDVGVQDQPRSTISMNAPVDMYTSARERVSHLIQPHEWATLRLGSGDSLFEWALGFMTGSLGFVQNLWNEVFADAPTRWDRAGSMIFFALFFSGMALFVVCRNRKSEFDNVVKDIDNRPKIPFGGQP